MTTFTCDLCLKTVSALTAMQYCEDCFAALMAGSTAVSIRSKKPSIDCEGVYVIGTVGAHQFYVLVCDHDWCIEGTNIKELTISSNGNCLAQYIFGGWSFGAPSEDIKEMVDAIAKYLAA